METTGYKSHASPSSPKEPQSHSPAGKQRPFNTSASLSKVPGGGGRVKPTMADVMDIDDSDCDPTYNPSDECDSDDSDTSKSNWMINKWVPMHKVLNKRKGKGSGQTGPDGIAGPGGSDQGLVSCDLLLRETEDDDSADDQLGELLPSVVQLTPPPYEEGGHQSEDDGYPGRRLGHQGADIGKVITTVPQVASNINVR